MLATGHAAAADMARRGSIDRAREVYGVVIDRSTWRVDAERTAEARSPQATGA